MSDFCPVSRSIDEHLDGEHDCEEQGHVWGFSRLVRGGQISECKVCGEEDFDADI
jgi:hypothetical protein